MRSKQAETAKCCLQLHNHTYSFTHTYTYTLIVCLSLCLSHPLYLPPLLSPSHSLLSLRPSSSLPLYSCLSSPPILPALSSQFVLFLPLCISKDLLLSPPPSFSLSFSLSLFLSQQLIHPCFRSSFSKLWLIL